MTEKRRGYKYGTNALAQVVHSRTFGTAAQEGGTAVHMLLPLVDFLNHSGDETECFPGDQAITTANVR